MTSPQTKTAAPYRPRRAVLNWVDYLVIAATALIFVGVLAVNNTHAARAQTLSTIIPASELPVAGRPDGRPGGADQGENRAGARRPVVDAVRKNLLGLNWTDLLVITACGLTFTAAFCARPPRPAAGTANEQAIQKMADELESPPTSSAVPPRSSTAGARQRPSPEQRDTARHTFAAVLNIPVARLDTVMRHHHPPPRRLIPRSAMTGCR